MSGIFGLVQFDGRPVDRAILERITAASSHRGPDGSGLWLEGAAAFGQQRLLTTSESIQELPHDDGRFVLTFDGRIDDAGELRSALGAKKAADDELVLRAYKAWG